MLRSHSKPKYIRSNNKSRSSQHISRSTKQRTSRKSTIQQRSISTSTNSNMLQSTVKSTPILTNNRPTVFQNRHNNSNVFTTPITSRFTLMPINSQLRTFSTTSPTLNTSSQQPTLSSVPQPDLSQEFYKLDLRVGLLDNVRDHPNAESLYLLDCHVGEDVPRQVVTNVKPHMSKESLTKRQQVVLTNLKPTAFRGEKSFAMFLGGTATQPTTTQGDDNSQQQEQQKPIEQQNGLATPHYIPTNNTQVISETFTPGQRLYLSGQSPIMGDIPRVNDKVIAKVFTSFSTDTNGFLLYNNQSVVFGPIENPVQITLGIPNAKIF